MKNPSVEFGDTVDVKHHMHDGNKKNVLNDVPFSNETTENLRIDDDNEDDDVNDNSRGHLSLQEIWNILFCFLAWACNVSIVTLGT